MTDLVARFSADPAALMVILFLAPFVLEEAAILAVAGVTTAGLLSPPLAFFPLLLGVLASDWFLFGPGHIAANVGRVRAWVGEKRIRKGRRILSRGTFAAAVTARLVPWLLPPIFLASGLVGVAFRTFALANGFVATVYTALVFVLAFEFNSFLVSHFREWGWIGVAAVALLLLILHMVGRSKPAG